MEVAHHVAIADVLNATRHALDGASRMLDASAELPMRVRKHLRRAAKLRHARGHRRAAHSQASLLEAPPPPAPSAAGIGSATQRMLVLGIISNPRTPHVRRWIRNTYVAAAGPAAAQGTVLLRFVMGRRGLNDKDQQQLLAEGREHNDIEHIDASDFAERGGIFSCIDKLFAWFPHAVRRFPGARFYGKADDDSYVDVRRLLSLVAPLSGVHNAYLGYVQYDSFIEDEWKHCGWSSGPVGAATVFRSACPRGRSYGPFPFVVGALTVMGGDLAQWMESSPQIASLVRQGRASQAHRTRHWDCGYSDVTLGYAFAKYSNVSVSLVSVRDAMRDATYGAMRGAHFVVAHHLRDERAFNKAHAEAVAAAEWVPHLEPCTAWSGVAARNREVTQAAGSVKEDGSLFTRGDTRDLKRAMKAFTCCQEWSVCEVVPKPLGLGLATAT